MLQYRGALAHTKDENEAIMNMVSDVTQGPQGPVLPVGGSRNASSKTSLVIVDKMGQYKAQRGHYIFLLILLSGVRFDFVGHSKFGLIQVCH